MSQPPAEQVRQLVRLHRPDAHAVLGRRETLTMRIEDVAVATHGGGQCLVGAVMKGALRRRADDERGGDVHAATRGSRRCRHPTGPDTTFEPSGDVPEILVADGVALHSPTLIVSSMVVAPEARGATRCGVAVMAPTVSTPGWKFIGRDVAPQTNAVARQNGRQDG